MYSAPTALEKQGNFSASSVTIYDPTAALQANGNRTPFPGNIIPGSRLNPVGQYIAGTYQPPATAPSKYGAADLPVTTTLPDRANQFTGKLDQDITRFWRASISYLRYFSLEPGDTYFGNVSAPSQWRLQRRVDTTQINNIVTISLDYNYERAVRF